MNYGIILPNFGRGITFDAVRQAALAAERLGYASVWTTDHVLVPRQNIDPYGNIFESLTTLALVAGFTQRVKLGTSVLVLPMRNAVLAAKQIATIDAATDGRMMVGVGVGWNEPEYRHLNANFKNRGKRLDEQIQVLRTLWSREDATFHGKYTSFDQAVFAPLPAQKGGIPIWIGGNGEPSFRRAAALGDGWHSTGASPEQVATGAKRIRELAPARRVLISARLSIDLNPNAPSTYQYRGQPRYRLAGTTETIRARLGEYAQAGLEYAVLQFPWDDVSLGLAQMEQFVREIRD